MPASRAALGQPTLSLADPVNERGAHPVGAELDVIGRRSLSGSGWRGSELSCANIRVTAGDPAHGWPSKCAATSSGRGGFLRAAARTRVPRLVLRAWLSDDTGCVRSAVPAHERPKKCAATPSGWDLFGRTRHRKRLAMAARKRGFPATTAACGRAILHMDDT